MICGITFFHCSTEEMATSKNLFVYQNEIVVVTCFLFSICEAFVQRLPFLFYFYYEGSNSRFFTHFQYKFVMGTDVSLLLVCAANNKLVEGGLSARCRYL